MFELSLVIQMGENGCVRLKALWIQAVEHKPTAASDARIGEALQPLTPGLNRSLRIESRWDRLTGDPGAVPLREILERSGIISWMIARLKGRRILNFVPRTGQFSY